MKSLNTYNYREELYMKPISYQVTVSDNDKVIKIEEDGDLIAELSFAIDGNILFLNGKDGLEVAQVELPISLAEIVKQRYNEETKEIELSILKTNGETVVFGLDVAELVNVYTAGDGIDITDNVISIKIKDENGPLHVDKHGLCIDMNTLATSDDVEQINAEILQIKGNAEILTEHVNNSINVINTNVANGFAVVNEAIATLNNVAETTVQHLNAETEERKLADSELQAALDEEAKTRLQQDIVVMTNVANIRKNLEEADAALQEQIGDVKGELEGSIADEINKLKEEIGNVTEDLEGSITEEINKIQEQIGDVKGELEGSIADAISTMKEDLNTEVVTRQEQDAMLENLIETKASELAENIASLNDELNVKIESLESYDEQLLEKVNAETDRAKAAEEELKSKLNDEIIARENGDNFLQKQLGDGFLSVANENARFLGVTVTKAVQLNKEAIDNEMQARIEGDNKTFNAVAVEKQERKDADNALDTKFSTSISDLASSIKLEKDLNNNLKYTLYVNGVSAGELNIPEDNMIETVTYNPETQELTFNWKTSIPQDPTIVSLAGLVDVYTASDGVILEESNFKINLTQSKYIGINENGGVEFVGVFQKREGVNWIYDLIGLNGENNGKFIDFTSDYESYNQHIQETYAPLTYVDEQDLSVKSELIGVEGDADDVNTLYGLRSAIAKSESVMSAKIAEEQDRAEGVEVDLSNRINVTKAELGGYVNQEIEKVNQTISDLQLNNDAKHEEIANNVYANSNILASLTNGEQTGVVDKLDRQFHEVTKDIDETKFEGLIKSLMDRISTLEATITTLVSGADVQGSVANVVANSLNEAKTYTDIKSVAALENAVAYANDTFQVKGDYITEIDAQYITESELANYDFVNNTDLTLKLTNYVTNEVADEKYQPVGPYLTTIDGIYVTETELAAMGYATKEYVNERDANFLTKEKADLMYAQTDVNDRYVTTNTLLSKGYATEEYVNNSVSDKLTKIEAIQTYQPIGNYLTSVPSEYVTESEIVLYDFARKSDLSAEVNNMKVYTDNKTHDMLTKTEAANIYQQKGEYITKSALQEYDYASKTDLMLATQGFVKVSDLSGYQPVGNYVTVSELDSKNYVNKEFLTSQNYVTVTALQGATADMQTKTDAAATYATKESLDKHIANAFTADNITAGDNIQLSRISNNVQIAVKLSENYNVVDTFGQGLPTAGNNLDLVAERLSNAVKKLHDTTDGEVF